MAEAHPFWEHLGGIYCINLVERDDRHQHAIQEFDSVGILDRVHFHRVHRHPVSGAIGLFEAVLEAMQIEKNKYADGVILKPIAIFEDDLLFQMDKLHYLDELVPFVDGTTGLSFDNWDTIRLGHMKTCFVEQVGKNIFRGNTLSTHAVVYSPCFVQKLLSINIVPSQLSGKMAHIDQYLKSVSGRNYIPWEQVVSQGDHGSDITWKICEGDTEVEKKQHVYLANAQAYIDSYWKDSVKMWKEVEALPVSERIKYYQNNWNDLADLKIADMTSYLLENKTLV